MADTPAAPPPRPGPSHGSDGPGLATRRLSSEQLEAVVRRAVELQARESESAGDTDLTVAELVRIGGELGIAPDYMRRALAEVATSPPQQKSVGDSILGPATVTASRAVPAASDDLRGRIERYLLDSVYLAVLRRLPDQTVYEKSGGFQVEFARAMDAARAVASGRGARPRIGAGFDLRTARTVSVAVSPLENGGSWVTLSADLGNQRAGYWAGIGAGGGAAAVAGATAAAIAIAPVAAVVAVPILGASAWVSRASYGSVVKRARLHLEALLDHLERGESLSPEPR